MPNPEQIRLNQNYGFKKYWHKWGPYLSERQWGTVREDYSKYGDAWNYFPHDHARSRVYRWGEDGIAGISETRCRICFSPAFWNGKDPILKERLFGLDGHEGNHGEDVKELYFHLDHSPSHSYMKYLYKYPQNAFPYDDLVRTNAQRSKQDREYEILDTGIFDDNAYFDIYIEYAKADTEDILIRITAHNRYTKSAPLYILPTIWLRNLWSFHQGMGQNQIQTIKVEQDFGSVEVLQSERGRYYLYFESPVQKLFTENETNTERLYGIKNKSPFVKDLFHDMVIQDDFSLMEGKDCGSKFAPMYHQEIPAGESFSVHLRLTNNIYNSNPLGNEFDEIFNRRIAECDEFYKGLTKTNDPELFSIQKQALSGMLWNKQYYSFDVNNWLNGDPGQPTPPPERKQGRNSTWLHLHNEDVLSMPDKWEFPWYATWDLAFHTISIAMIDVEWAKLQLNKIMREWYMSPRGQIPAYEWNFSDVNPPVQAWATMEVYKIDREIRNGQGDIEFLKRIFHKLNLNFTWWVNQKDRRGNNVIEGGFLGLDNIGVFDRNKELPGAGFLEQVDGTAWVAMFALKMLKMAIEIAVHDPSYEDMATKYFEHFIYISTALNKIGKDWTGLWDEEDGFFYDLLVNPEKNSYRAVKVRSIVGLSTLFGNSILRREDLDQLPTFTKGVKWFYDYRRKHNEYEVLEEYRDDKDILLSLIPRERIRRLLNALADPEEFFSPFGIRSLSKIYESPYHFKVDGDEYSIQYNPGESRTTLFGGNSNWRGPVWFPMNYLLIQSIEEYYDYYGDSLRVDHPDDPDNPEKSMSMQELCTQLHKNLISIFRKDEKGRRPVNANHPDWFQDPHFRDLILFHEHFHGDTGRGLGASHQTGWTGLVANMINQVPDMADE